MMKNKSMSSSSPSFAKGGKTKMFGKSASVTQNPGTSSPPHSDGGGKFAKGGSTKMFGPQEASPAKPC